MEHLALDNYQTADWFSVFKELNYAIIITDKNGYILFCNNKYLEVCKYNTLGITREKAVGMHIEKLLQLGGVQKYDSSIVNCLERKAKVVGIYEAPIYKIVLSTAIPAMDENGDIKFVYAVVQDESEIFRMISTEGGDSSLRKIYTRYLRVNEKRMNKGFVFVSDVMQQIADQCVQVSNSDIPVLLMGESGVGKEVLSRLIHKSSERNKHPFMAINCGAIPEQLIESELFGYEPGAFTGASGNGKMGVFEAANKGTILLDEIGDISPSMQVKLLRVLENRQVVRIGSVRPVQVDFRLISATNKNLREKVEKGEFRQDLYYRINAFRVTIPSLRERRDDISALAIHYLSFYNLKYKLNRRMSSEVLGDFIQYRWPGNIRELKNVIEQVVVLSKDDNLDRGFVRSVLGLEDDKRPGGPGDNGENTVVVRQLIPIKQAVESAERQVLEMVAKKTKSSYEAAEVLGIDQTTVLRKMKKYGIKGFL